MSDATAAPGGFQGYGTKPYRAYILGILVVIYTFNFIDRLLISIVGEAIREDFGVSNFMLGLLGGPVFAILYTTLGIPIARLAERANRITIVSIGAFFWSLMTAACGFAGNFVQLALCRLGVGIGEAACVPPSQSAIADYFPADRRASALSIFSLGIPLGSALAFLGGGWLVANFDWRTAFILLGVPGIAAAILLKLTVKEPPRSGGQATPPKFGETLKALSTKVSFWHVAFGGALISFVGYGSSQFLVSHLVRNYTLGATPAQEIAHASYAMGAVAGISTALGTFLGGFLVDRLSTKHARVTSWLPALGVGLAIPLYVMSFLQTDFTVAFIFLMLAPIFHYMYLGPMYAVTMGVSQPLQRATSIAILLLIVNLIGYGLGPPFVGAVNDWFAAQILADTTALTLADCNPASVAAENAATCAAANATGLKYALATTILFLGWAAVHFLLAGQTLVKDRVVESAMAAAPPLPVASAAVVRNEPTQTGVGLFVSYASADRSLADALVAQLESAGVRCWIAPRDIRAGLSYAEEITHGIEEARAFCVLISDAANTSSSVLGEVELARRFERRILPVFLNDTTPSKALLYYLGSTQWLNYTREPERTLEQLRAAVSRD